MSEPPAGQQSIPPPFTGGTIDDMVDLLVAAGHEGGGGVAPSTIRAYRSATVQIISDRINPSARVDELDVDMLIHYWLESLRPGDYESSTINSYIARFKSAVELYMRYLRDPEAFWNQRSEDRRWWVRASDVLSLGPAEVMRMSDGTPIGRDELVRYPFPLESGEMAYLELPRDLSAADADRMVKFISSLVVVDRESRRG